MNKTFFRSEVKLIDYSKNSKKSVIITTTNGKILKADHVILTVSLGVLKEKHEMLFVPKLPIDKIKAIEVCLEFSIKQQNRGAKKSFYRFCKIIIFLRKNGL